MKTFFLSLLTAGLFLASCKKTDNSVCKTIYTEQTDNDTVLPSPYLMTYPGSVWVYDDGTTTTCNTWEQVGLIETSQSNGCKTVHTTHVIAAHTSFGYIQGINELVFPGTEQTSLSKPLLSETTGTFYEHVTQLHYDQFGGTDTETRNVLELLDSLTVLGVTYYDVIHVSQSDQYMSNHTYSGGFTFKHSYYARHIGLIRATESVNTDPPSIRNLVSYTIGPH
jgi:hypothetical protein